MFRVRMRNLAAGFAGSAYLFRFDPLGETRQRQRMFAANGSRRIGLRLPFLLLAALIVGIMAFSAGTLVWQARQSTLAEAHAAHRGTARALSRHVFHVVRSSEVLLDQMLSEWQRRDGPAALHQSLQQLLRPLSELNVAVIIDGEGNMLAASYVHPPPPTSFADRAWVKAHQAGADFVIGEPVISRNTDTPIITVSRARRDENGRLLAIAVVGIQIRYLEQLFAETHADAGRAVTLFRDDGTLLARNPPAQIGARFPNADAVRRLKAEPTGSAIVENTVIDGLARLNAWDRVGDYPMVLVVGQSVDKVLEPWRAFTLRVVLLLAVVAAALVLAGRFALAGIRREERGLAVAEVARKRAESTARELARANHSLSSVLAAAPEGIIGTDSQHRVIFVNDAALALVGRERDEMVGALLHELVHHHRADGSEYPAEDCAMRKHLAEAALCTVSDEVFWRKDGTSFPVEYTAGRLEIADGGHGCVVVFHDIGARRQMEEELKRSNADLEQFAYAVSHDLQEPLRTISGFVGLLKRRYGEALPAEAVEFIDTAVGGVARMSGMIDDLLAYSRIGRPDIQPAPLDLGLCAARARDSLMAAIDAAGATIELAPLPEVAAIESQMVSLFQNLLGNAIKYAAPERRPHVTVASRREGGDWVIRVTDNGMGIPAADRERVFQVFQRLHRRGISGSGVGLALCRRIAERHHGSIHVEDREDGQPGCVFVLHLPAATPLSTP